MGVAVVDSVRIRDIITCGVRAVAGYKRKITSGVFFIVSCINVEWVGAVYITIDS